MPDACQLGDAKLRVTDKPIPGAVVVIRYVEVMVLAKAANRPKGAINVAGGQGAEGLAEHGHCGRPKSLDFSEDAQAEGEARIG